MSARALYILRDESRLRDPHHMYFKSISGDGCDVNYAPQPENAYRFTKEQMADFRRTHSHVKGRTVLLSREIERFTQ